MAPAEAAGQHLDLDGADLGAREVALANDGHEPGVGRELAGKAAAERQDVVTPGRDPQRRAQAPVRGEPRSRRPL